MNSQSEQWLPPTTEGPTFPQLPRPAPYDPYGYQAMSQYPGPSGYYSQMPQYTVPPPSHAHPPWGYSMVALAPPPYSHYSQFSLGPHSYSMMASDLSPVPFYPPGMMHTYPIPSHTGYMPQQIVPNSTWNDQVMRDNTLIANLHQFPIHQTNTINPAQVTASEQANAPAFSLPITGSMESHQSLPQNTMNATQLYPNASQGMIRPPPDGPRNNFHGRSNALRRGPRAITSLLHRNALKNYPRVAYFQPQRGAMGRVSRANAHIRGSQRLPQGRSTLMPDAPSFYPGRTRFGTPEQTPRSLFDEFSSNRHFTQSPIGRSTRSSSLNRSEGLPSAGIDKSKHIILTAPGTGSNGILAVGPIPDTPFSEYPGLIRPIRSFVTDVAAHTSSSAFAATESQAQSLRRAQVTAENICHQDIETESTQQIQTSEAETQKVESQEREKLNAERTTEEQEAKQQTFQQRATEKQVAQHRAALQRTEEFAAEQQGLELHVATSLPQQSWVSEASAEQNFITYRDELVEGSPQAREALQLPSNSYIAHTRTRSPDQPIQQLSSTFEMALGNLNRYAYGYANWQPDSVPDSEYDRNLVMERAARYQMGLANGTLPRHRDGWVNRDHPSWRLIEGEWRDTLIPRSRTHLDLLNNSTQVPYLGADTIHHTVPLILQSGPFDTNDPRELPANPVTLPPPLPDIDSNQDATQSFYLPPDLSPTHTNHSEMPGPTIQSPVNSMSAIHALLAVGPHPVEPTVVNGVTDHLEASNHFASPNSHTMISQRVTSSPTNFQPSVVSGSWRTRSQSEESRNSYVPRSSYVPRPSHPYRRPRRLERPTRLERAIRRNHNAVTEALTNHAHPESSLGSLPGSSHGSQYDSIDRKMSNGMNHSTSAIQLTNDHHQEGQSANNCLSLRGFIANPIVPHSHLYADLSEEECP